MINTNLFDFKAIFTVIASTEGMKRNQLRPLRAEIIELAIEKYSAGQLQYVGNLQNGMDFVGLNCGLRYESKSMDGMFKKRVPDTKKFILMNFHGATGNLPSQTFDYILLWDTTNRIVGIADWNAAIKNAKVNGSNVETFVEARDITFICNGTPINPPQNLAHQLMQWIKSVI